MTRTHEPVSVEVAHQRFKTLLKLTALALVVTFIVGGIGGYMIYQNSSGQRVYTLVLAIPGLIAAAVTCIPIRIQRSRWFENSAAVMAASRKEPYPPQAEDAAADNETSRAA